jgi:RNA-directed DNA polymerase
LQESWRRLRKGAAVGVDAINAKTYAENLDNNLKELLINFKTKRYQPPPVRRVFIPKADGKQRPLGIPTIEDKIVQNAVTFLLTAVYEQDFHSMSYGFRPNRNAHQALEEVKATIAQKKVSWVLDADIQSFFDMIDHEWLIKFIQHRIADKAIISLIKRWLRAGVMEEGKLMKAASGSPQGGVISPILANIYLHYVIDEWVTKVVNKHLKGEFYAFRYADDVLFCFQFRKDAIRFNQVLKKRLLNLI